MRWYHHLKIYWKIRKLIQPEFVEARNNYIQSIIDDFEKQKKIMGEERFNRYFGEDYIDRLKSDLV